MPDQNFQKLINQRIDEFVADITTLAREHAVKTLADALAIGGGGASRMNGSSRRRPASAGRRKRGQAELDELGQTLLDHIAGDPGLKITDLAAALSTTPKELALPARRLIAEKKVRTEGQKRSTAYYPTARGRKAAKS